MLKGRKVRDLKSGRFYVSKNQKKSSKLRSEKRLACMDFDVLLKNINKSIGRKMGRKRSKSAKAYYKKNPGEFSRRAKEFYKDNTELKRKRRKDMLLQVNDICTTFTDPERCRKHFNTSKEGVEVVYKTFPRKKVVETATGVVHS